MTFDELRVELMAALVDAGLADAKVLSPLAPEFHPVFMVEMVVADGRKCCMTMECSTLKRTSRADMASQIRSAYERFLERTATASQSPLPPP
jgi:hypothetical protein